MVDAPHLFMPYRLSGLELANRVVVAPMCQYSALDGLPTAWHHVHLGTMALSGAGLVLLEATGVTPEGRITPTCLGIWSDAHTAALAEVVHGMRRLSPAAVGIQLAHAGRKASTRPTWEGGSQIAPADGGWQPVGPSAVAHRDTDIAPAELSLHQLDELVERFTHATQRAREAGFDVVEIHAAHGYLLHQFLSPLANRRTDAYGGSRENRMRFPLRVVQAVRGAWPADRPLLVRISATDWVEGGWTVEDSVVLARELRACGVDLVDCSSGGVSTAQQLDPFPGYQVPLAEQVRREAGIPTMAVGLITDPHHAEEIVASGRADLVALARGVLWDPRWGWHAAAALGATAYVPPQYHRAAPA